MRSNWIVAANGWLRPWEIRPDMRPFSSLVNRAPGAMPPPDALIEEAQSLGHSVTTPEEAVAAYNRMSPLLRDHAPEPRLFIACAMMLEKQRLMDGMLAAWADLQSIFPTEPFVIRMLMRWYRRSRQIEEGLQRLHQITPDVFGDPAMAELRLVGYQELNTFAEIDRMMAEVLQLRPNERTLRVKYIQALMKQGRFLEAARTAKALGSREKLGPATRTLIEEAEARARSLELTEVEDVADVLGHVVGRFRNRVPHAQSQGGIGPVMFFTGQLGAGGAERQMTRLAAALQGIWDSGTPLVEGHRLLSPPQVCVRHATPSSGADFFLPVLQMAGVATTVLADLPVPDVAALGDLPPGIADILTLLPEDVQQNTLKLVPLLRQAGIETAYLWQDGGVLTAALAALLAGVPRIVTSFRGLPPNLRPELMRPQMPMLFRELARVPGVSFTANSQATARAYEDWLGLPDGFIQVVHNAVPEPDPSGGAGEEAIWQGIIAASSQCSRTVLGIFRFDHNKRPDLWVRVAMDHARRNPDTRFVVVGAGVEHARCRQMTEDAGMADRVFLPGATFHVGYYLHRADLVMHLARFEGLPNVLIEAQLAGRPVLATPAGGTSEIVLHGETGHILGDNLQPDPDEIAQALDFMLADRERLSQMGTAAKHHSRDRFLIDRILASTLSMFDAAQSGDASACALS
jgi:glycosyltransferase involved in cell wall biosynthesis